MTPKPRKHRILYVLHHMAVGGSQKQVVETVNRLNPELFSSDVACITAGGANLQRISGAGEVYVLGAGKIYDAAGISAVMRLRGIIRKGGYSIVEAYLPAAHFMSAAALLGVSRTALIASLRQDARLDPHWMTPIHGFLNRATLLSIANSHAVKRSVVARYGVRPGRVMVVPNVISAGGRKFDRAAAREEWAISASAFVVTAVGTISPIKDYPTIVRAFAALSRRVRDAVLLVAGDGKQRRSVCALARDLGLNGRVRFLGTVHEPGRVLGAADVFVHASQSEGMSNAVLEAMCAGLPMVISDIPANREAAGADCAAYFAPGDWNGCLKGLAGFADDRAAAARCGVLACARAERICDPRRAIRRRERIYRTIAGVLNG